MTTVGTVRIKLDAVHVQKSKEDLNFEIS